MYSVVFRTLDREKYVAFGDERMRMPVHTITDHGLSRTKMIWPSCTNFMEVYIDQRETDAWTKEEILERYGGMRVDWTRP